MSTRAYSFFAAITALLALASPATQAQLVTKPKQTTVSPQPACLPVKCPTNYTFVSCAKYETVGKRRCCVKPNCIGTVK